MGTTNEAYYVIPLAEIANVLENLQRIAMRCGRAGSILLPDGTAIDLPIGQSHELKDRLSFTLCLVVYGDSAADVSRLIDERYPAFVDHASNSGWLIDLEVIVHVVAEHAVFLIWNDDHCVGQDFVIDGLIAQRFHQIFSGVSKVLQVHCCDGEPYVIHSDKVSEKLLQGIVDEELDVDLDRLTELFRQSPGSKLPVADGLLATPTETADKYKLDDEQFEFWKGNHLFGDYAALLYLEKCPTATTEEIAGEIERLRGIEVSEQQVANVKNQAKKREPACSCRCCPINPYWKARSPAGLNRGTK